MKYRISILFILVLLSGCSSRTVKPIPIFKVGMKYHYTTQSNIDVTNEKDEKINSQSINLNVNYEIKSIKEDIATMNTSIGFSDFSDSYGVNEDHSVQIETKINIKTGDVVKTETDFSDFQKFASLNGLGDKEIEQLNNLLSEQSDNLSKTITDPGKKSNKIRLIDENEVYFFYSDYSSEKKKEVINSAIAKTESINNSTFKIRKSDYWPEEVISENLSRIQINSDNDNKVLTIKIQTTMRAIHE